MPEQHRYTLSSPSCGEICDAILFRRIALASLANRRSKFLPNRSSTNVEYSWLFWSDEIDDREFLPEDGWRPFAAVDSSFSPISFRTYSPSRDDTPSPACCQYALASENSDPGKNTTAMCASTL
ncbi:hypothetical protein OGATHE_003038 [Ogataea polymorpha]|uniref:Uncharacterized protein n=1 Tax=Ogataea polymorpha TaxID=460523 RepID=A0A9P8PES6_9ASCO|nr:hypothetical protein OGATHE_003038 [Ogataea polymorpha]